MVIVIEASRANILPTEDKIFLIRNFLMKHDARKWGLFTAVIFKAFKKGNSMSFQFMVSPSRTQYSFWCKSMQRVSLGIQKASKTENISASSVYVVSFEAWE